VTIAGPAVRLDEARMKQLGGALVETARELAGLSTASSLLRRKDPASAIARSTTASRKA